MVNGSTLVHQSMRSGQVLLLAAMSLAGFASEASDVPLSRYNFTDENAPPHIHFHNFLNKFRAEADARWASLDLAQLGFTESEIPETLAYFSELQQEVDREVDRSWARIACTDAAASLGGLQIRTIYNSYDDLMFAIASKYLAIAAAELAARNHPDFVEGLVELDGSFRVIGTDHRFAWGDDDVEIQQNRLAICRGINERIRG